MLGNAIFIPIVEHDISRVSAVYVYHIKEGLLKQTTFENECKRLYIYVQELQAKFQNVISLQGFVLLNRIDYHVCEN